MHDANELWKGMQNTTGDPQPADSSLSLSWQMVDEVERLRCMDELRKVAYAMKHTIGCDFCCFHSV